jgi:hypothetical protein
MLDSWSIKEILKYLMRFFLFAKCYFDTITVCDPSANPLTIESQMGWDDSFPSTIQK